MWLERQAAERPDAPAVDGMTYAELHERARATATSDPHPIAHPPGIEFAVELHAVLLRGGTAIPIDLRLTEEEQRRLTARMQAANIAQLQGNSRPLYLPPEEYFTTVGSQELVCLAPNGNLVSLRDPSCPPEVRNAQR